MAGAHGYTDVAGRHKCSKHDFLYLLGEFMFLNDTDFTRYQLSIIHYQLSIISAVGSPSLLKEWLYHL
jgi:hypothetical protein